MYKKILLVLLFLFLLAGAWVLGAMSNRHPAHLMTLFNFSNYFSKNKNIQEKFFKDKLSLKMRKQAREYILPLNNPDSVYAEEAKYMHPEDLIIGLVINDQAKAYPWYILSRYHVVNDIVAGQPLAITLCETCSGSSAFIPKIDMLPRYFLTFQVCDKAKYGTFQICDIETRSRWHPFVGKAMKGLLKGSSLKRVPVFYESWENWRVKHPRTLVLNGSDNIRNRQHAKHIHISNKYINEVFKKVSNFKDKRLPHHDLVFALFESEKKPAAIPLKNIGKLSQFEWDHTPYVIFLENKHRVGIFKRKIKGIVRDFKLHSSSPFQMIDSEQNIWNDMGEAISGPLKGSKLQPASGYLTEWYEWVSFQPESHIIKPYL